jgi:DnaJ-domain-containing protein 1
MGLIRLILYFFIAAFIWKLFMAAATAKPTVRVRTRPQPPSQRTAHAILGVSPQATLQEIRHAYQTLVQQYHPDKVADMGPELRDLAERRTQEINAAYTELKARF